MAENDASQDLVCTVWRTIQNVENAEAVAGRERGQNGTQAGIEPFDSSLLPVDGQNDVNLPHRKERSIKAGQFEQDCAFAPAANSIQYHSHPLQAAEARTAGRRHRSGSVRAIPWLVVGPPARYWGVPPGGGAATSLTSRRYSS